MIKSLIIRNFAVIEQIEVEFREGLNLLTGETGSGKSIIVDALGLLLGERGSLSQIRTGERSAFIEGIFELAGEGLGKVQEILEEAGIDDWTDNEIIVRREVSANGKSRVFVNDRSVTLAILRQLQPQLVEIHGQGEQKLLLLPRAQMDLLDSYAGCQQLRKDVSGAFRRWKNALADLRKLLEESMERERTIELLQYQLTEIDDISPQAGEDERLAKERHLMSHAERILQVGNTAYAGLYENDKSVLATLSTIIKQMQELRVFDDQLQPLLEHLTESSALLAEAADNIRRYLENIDFSPEEFAQVDNRLSELDRLKRKFGADLNGIQAIRDGLKQKLEKLSDLTLQERRLRDELHKSQQDYMEKAALLSARRVEASSSLAAEVTKDLRQVAMPHVQFCVAIKSNSSQALLESEDEDLDALSALLENGFFSSYGADQVSFLFNANPGESLKPLAQAASGGELSRLMLTLLTVGMKNRNESFTGETIIFDEIDAGIGGGVAEAVGRRLKLLARAKQVLCVTHQPQIARFADAHYSVYKIVRAGKTLTSIEYLEREERVKELARMIAGEQEALTTIETARWMLENA